MTQILPSQTQWGKYRSFEGPWFPGTVGYTLPTDPSQQEIELATITATEGGHFDAANFYDRCICTMGLIQWCEQGQFSVSDMLGEFVEATSLDFVQNQLHAALEQSKSTFKKNPRGRYRFHFLDERGEVDRATEQQQLFLLRSNGQQGTWDTESKSYAKMWVARLVSLFGEQDTIKPQVLYTTKRLQGFLLPYSKDLYRNAPNTNLGNAFRAGLLSFAANNPSFADKYVRAADQGERYTLQWLVSILTSLTFGPRVAIYPGRYNKIRPVLERVFSIDLPDVADQLQGFHKTEAGTAIQPKDVQTMLKRLGYDLGNYGPNKDGIDDQWGKLTTQALRDFQEMYGLAPIDGQPGRATIETLRAVVASLASDEQVAASDRRKANADLALQTQELIQRLNTEARNEWLRANPEP